METGEEQWTCSENYIPSRSSTVGCSERLLQPKVTLDNIMMQLNGIETNYNGFNGKYGRLLEMFELQVEENKTLKSELCEVQKELANLKNDNNPQNIIDEVNETVNRAKNVMLFRLAESGHEALDARINHDTDVVAKILAPANVVHSDIVKVVRMGKRVVPSRPTKVVFPNSEIAAKVLKCRSSILSASKGKIYLQADQTMMQRTCITNARKQLDQRRQAGEMSLSLKVINGKPTIVRNKNEKN
ncbi:hypothetical protein HHI36_005994 [Cryptolaemus montrouzieri]|uniref:Uncharacterized protein n=1 Tax=Cryptolaemus montrouzieri TaxID=559131 RepID=A0ABD2NVP2_9CUCU